MAERRMFAKSIVLSDAFLDMPLSARCLYFTLGMLADDDGFVSSPKAIMRQCGASQDDMAVLLQKRFILAFESGVIVIKHWRMNNYLQNDRHKATTYKEELATLTLDDKGAYTEVNKIAVSEVMYTECIQPVYEMDTQVSIGKDSIVKDSIDNNPPYIPPTEKKKSSNLDISQMLEESDLSDNVKESVKEWISYKKEQFRFSYKPTGFKAFLTEIHNNETNLGVDAVCEAIRLSMGKGYKGIIWDLVKKNTSGNAYMQSIQDRVNVVDSW